MISIISDFDSLYQIRRRLGDGIHGYPIGYSPGAFDWWL
jgi:hypothetical protein